MGEATDDLRLGRSAYAQNAWRDAYAALAAAERNSTIPADDLVLLAMSALLTGKFHEGQTALERAHQAFLDGGAPLLAARVAVFLGMNLAIAGEIGSAGGWFGRAQRIVEREGEDCVERGYLLLPVMFRHEAAADYDGAYEAAVESVAIAERFRDVDLLAMTLHVAGLARIKQGRIDDGLALLDEAMVSVAAGEVAPFFAGIVYCGVIASCEEAFEPRRAGSGPTRSPNGASPSPSWCRSRAGASPTAPASSNSTAIGPAHWRRRGSRVNVASRR